MSDRPSRPILHLKLGTPASFKPQVAEPAAPPPEPVQHAWKCKPCGTGLDVAEDLADGDAVRCPSCNARLGLAGDFRSDPPLLEKLRARPLKR